MLFLFYCGKVLNLWCAVDLFDCWVCLPHVLLYIQYIMYTDQRTSWQKLVYYFVTI